jgi:DnaK suppressor protein
MKKATLDLYKQRLLALQSRLRGDVSQLADSALKASSGDLSSMPIHMADVGSDNYEQDFTLSLMENEQVALEAIADALERIQDGSYGSCVECGKTIPKARLDVLPYTPMCIACATKLEQG